MSRGVRAVCAMCTVLGLCPPLPPLPPLGLHRLWGLCLYPGLVLSLALCASDCPLFDSVFFLFQHFYVQLQARGVSRLVAELPDSGRALPWLGLSLLSLLWEAPACLLQESGLPACLCRACLSAPARLAALLAAALAHSLLAGLLPLLPLPEDQRWAEDRRLRLHAALGLLHTAAALLEPLVVLVFATLGGRLLASAFFLLWDESHLRWHELASPLADLLVLGLASHLTHRQLDTIDKITHVYISERIYHLNAKARMQIVHSVKMINDQHLDDFVTITKLFIASFAGFMTTYLITIIQLLPQLGQVALHYFQLCGASNSNGGNSTL